MDTIQRIHPLDNLIYDNSLFMLEAMVPFVEYPYKKLLVLYIKYRELASLMRCLDDRTHLSKCGFDCHPKSTDEIISCLCSFLPGNYSEYINQMKQMMSMMSMMDMMTEKTENNCNDNVNKNSTVEDDKESLYDSILSILEDKE